MRFTPHLAIPGNHERNSCLSDGVVKLREVLGEVGVFLLEIKRSVPGTSCAT